MRLSLMKAAHAVVSSAAYRKSGSALPFDRHGDGITTSETEGRNSLMHIAAHHFINQRHQNTRAAGADGMPDRDRSTVHVDFCRIQANFLHHAQSLHGKRLV